MAETDTKFVGPVPQVYDALMVPMLFQPYAEDMAARVVERSPNAVLETAAGSGVVPRVLAPLLAAGTRYVVTDLNAPMLDQAKARQGPEQIEWAVADALALPFDDATFDVVCCQFGVMFFPDRTKGYAEALRVLKPGAPFIFSVWDSLAENAVPSTVWDAVLARYPVDPPRFFEKVPHGYHDADVIRTDLAMAGFQDVQVEWVSKVSHAAKARDAAGALMLGTPFRMEIAARDPQGLSALVDATEAALIAHFGTGPIAAPMRALVVTARA